VILNTPTALTAAALLVCGPMASAAVVYSGVVGIPIATTFEGTYVDLETGDSGDEAAGVGTADGSSYTVGSAPTAGWDVNFFFGGIFLAHSPNFQPFRDDTADNRSYVHTVPVGTLIDAASAAANTLATPGFGGSGQSNGSTVGEAHFGAGPSQFTSGVEAYIAFVLDPEGNPLYGWMRVTLQEDGSPGVIHDWAYSPDSILVGTVPEPSGVLLLGAAGLLGVFRRRRIGSPQVA
jgi:hypothetical protein